MTANQDLADSAVAHGVLLEALKNNEARELLKLLNVVLADLVRLVERRLSSISVRGFDRSPVTSKRLAQLMDAIDAVVDRGYLAVRGPMFKSLREIIQSEARWQVTNLKKWTPIKVNFLAPAPETLRAIITSRPMQGALLKDWYQALPRGTKEATKRAINLGIAQGETHAQIVQRLRGTKALGFTDGVLNRPRKELEKMTRAYVTHVTAHAHAAVMEENKKYLKGEQWVAALDTITCPRCGAIDGKLFPVGEGPAEGSIHFECRCKRAPVLKSWKELGLPLNEIGPGTRASMDGQVAADMKFPQWLKRQSPERIEQVLGPTRAKLWRGNRLKFDSFTNDKNQLLTLDQLRALELGG